MTKPFIDKNEFDFNFVEGSYDLDNMTIVFDPRIGDDQYLQLNITCDSVGVPFYQKKLLLT